MKHPWIRFQDITRRLELKGQKFRVFTAASDEELDELWTAILSIDQQFTSSSAKRTKLMPKTSHPNWQISCCTVVSRGTTSLTF